MTSPVDVAVIGAGPSGLACAIEAGRLGCSTVVLEQGCIVDAIRRFPTQMVFFTTRELLEIGGIPMSIAQPKPTRAEALAYYAAVARHFGLDVRQYEKVVAIEGEDGAFELVTRDRFGAERRHSARKVVLATGYFDHPNRLGIEGEQLPHVAHYYQEAHVAVGLDVLVAGGGNSACEAALEMFRAGARVHLVVRAPDLDPGVKYWVRPDVRNRIEAGQIQASFGTRVVRIEPGAALLRGEAGETRVKADLVFLLIGYHPDYDLLRNAGVELDPVDKQPALDPETYESNVKGLYLAGSVICGRSTNQIFIENGRLHAERIAPHLARALGR